MQKVFEFKRICLGFKFFIEPIQSSGGDEKLFKAYFIEFSGSLVCLSQVNTTHTHTQPYSVHINHSQCPNLIKYACKSTMYNVHYTSSNCPFRNKQHTISMEHTSLNLVFTRWIDLTPTRWIVFPLNLCKLLVRFPYKYIQHKIKRYEDWIHAICQPFH